jgi:hemolysin III
MKKHLQRHPEHSLFFFFKKTISAQLHLLGTFMAVLGLIVLLYFSEKTSSPVHVIGCIVFGVTGILVFSSSTLYHFCSDGFIISEELEKWLNYFDHFSIYLFIAGTYTPFLINAVKEPWKYILLISIWVIALLGILYTYFKPRLPQWAQHRLIYTSIFLLMGWTLAVRWDEVYSSLSALNFNFLVAGGLSYSVGAVIYAFEWPNLHKEIFGAHEIWHILVMCGYVFHYFLILGYYI